MTENTEKVEFAEALFDNESEWPGELEFRRGEILRIVEKKLSSSTDGWWVCCNNRGSRGIVPANRLKILDIPDFSFENRYFPFFDRDFELPSIGDRINVEIPRLSDFDDRFSSMNRNPSNNRYIERGSPIRRMIDFPDHDRLLSEFKNFRLLHGIDKPYKMYNSDDVNTGNNNGESFYSLPKKNGVTVRNVPIIIEKQNGVADQSFPSCPALPISGNQSKSTNIFLPRTVDKTTTSRNNEKRPKSPPAPPTRRQVVYNADAVGNPTLGSLKMRQDGFTDGPSSFGCDSQSDTYDLLPKRESPVIATLSRPRKSVNDPQQQPHRVRFAKDYGANNAAHPHSLTVDNFIERQISSSDADDRSSSITLTSSSADSSFSNGSSTTANGASVRAKHEDFYDVPRHLSTANSKYDGHRMEKDELRDLGSNATQKSQCAVDSSLVASIYDAPLSSIQLPTTPSTSLKTSVKKSQLNHKLHFDDYDFVDTVAKNGAKNFKNATHVEPTNDFYQEKLEILAFYVPQVDSQMEGLNRAIDDFLSSVEANSPPRDFVAKSRFVVLSAHKLVYLGDSLSHCLKNLSSDDRDRSSVDKLSSSCDRLCDALKSCVASTKQACSTFPCVEDVQTMVDSMVRISNDAHEFKLSVAQLARR